MGNPFIGRLRELEIVATACAAARAGHRQVVAVRAEAGIGKTSFATEIAARAEDDGFTVVWGRCWAHGGAPPLWPWQPILGELLGAQAAALLADDPGRADVDPERFARFAAVADRLGTAIDRPTLIVLDDLHNADAGGLLLTRFLARSLDRAPLLMLFTARPQPPGAPTGALLDELTSDALTVVLPRFDLRETIALLGAHGDADLDPHLVATLLRVTGGSPLLLARAVTGGTVGTAIDQAVAGLPSAARGIVALAAVLGPAATVAEIAALAGDPVDFVVEAMRAAEQAGLVALTRDEVAFAHDLTHEAALAALPPAELLDAHARAASLLAGDDRGEHVVRRARHALAATARSDADAAVAVDAARAAAAVMRRGYDDQAAAELFEQALAIADRLPPRVDWVRLPLELASTLLSCGRLADARPMFQRAAEAADGAADTVAGALAALGLGGLWLNEHRDPVRQQEVLARQRAALAALDERETALRCRLEMRLAAEAVYAGGSIDAVVTQLDVARGIGGVALAEALSVTHHALLAPGNDDALLAIADELIAVASASGEAMLAVMGLMWRTVDLYHLADARAERSLNELRRRVEALGCRSIAYIVAAIDVMRLIREGRLDEAEQAASAALALGEEVGDADAVPYYAAHLLTIRYFQGRETELLELAAGVSTSPVVMARERGLQAALAMIAARAGRHAQARALLDQLSAGDLQAAAPSSTSLAAVAAMIEAAAELGDAELARRLYAELEPFAALPVTPSLAVTCLGSAERFLGLAALAFGDRPLAASHLERAVAANRALGHEPAMARCRAELAALAGPAEPEVVLERSGSQWIAIGGDRRITLPDLVGMGYLHELIGRAGEDIPAAELCGAGLVDGARHELIDRTTLDRYRRRVAELDADIAEADDDNDLGRAERLRLEREALREQLRETLALGGRQRRFADTGERARTAVHKALKRALEAIGDRDPAFAGLLRQRLTTGTVCRYDAPSPDRPQI